MLIVVLCARTAALTQSFDVSHYGHTAWTAREGFVNAGIIAIAQSADGYLWFATTDNLVRFDGVRAVPWQPPGGESLVRGPIHALLAARDGTVWIGTHSGLVQWNGQRLVPNERTAGQLITELFEDREGKIWASTGVRPGRLCAVQGTTTACVGDNGQFGDSVGPVFEDSRRRLWVSASNGAWRWQPDRTRILEGHGGASAWTETADGVVLAAKDGRIWQVAGVTAEPFPVPFRGSCAEPTITNLLTDRSGAIWMGTLEHGLLHRQIDGRVDAYTRVDGLSGNTVTSLFEDREGNIWVATNNGLDRFRALSASTYSVAQGVPGRVGSVLVDRDHSVWASSALGLYRLRDRRTYVYRSQALRPEAAVVTETIVPNLPESPVGALYQDRRGRVWLGTAAGLGYFAATAFVRVAGAPAGFVDAITEDTEGNVWIANRDAGLLRISADGALEQFGWASLTRGFATWVWRVAPDPVQGGVWLAYHAGRVAYFRSGKVQMSYSRAEGLGSGAVHDIRVSADGTVWVGTDGGLSRIRAGRVATLSTANGLPCNSVDSTIEDAGGGIWLYTPCGVVHLPPAEMRGWADVIDRGGVAPQVRPIILDSRDGAPRAVASSLTMTPHMAIGADGKIWLAAQDGIAVVDSIQLPRNLIPPPVHIEQLVADRRAYDARAEVRLPPRARDLQIDYTALSLVAPEKNSFRIVLEGRDAEWQDVGTRRQAFYTDLGPGSYRFRVVASNNSGVWNEAGASLEFSIAPAYYQTRWFRALVVAAVLGLMWAGYVGRVRRVARQYQRRLDERVDERTRIARELHDTLLQSFHALVLRFQTVLNLLPDRPADARQRLEAALEQADEAIIEGRNALQGLRTSTVEHNDLANAIRTIGDKLARESTAAPPPAFAVVVEGHSRDLHPIARDEIYKIAAESVRNAFQHAQARHINVDIRYEHRHFRLVVRDDGNGIEPAVLAAMGKEGHYGLRGLPERASVMGGRLTVWSEPNIGTEVELRVPASAAYARTSHAPPVDSSVGSDSWT
jgi:signal transduction histidine kinase/ligand-binding sensor domain-containing protein